MLDRSDAFSLDLANLTQPQWQKTNKGNNEYNPAAPHARSLVGSVSLFL